MKKIVLGLIISLCLSPVFAQEEAAQEESSSAPVRFTFGTSRLIDNQTTEIPYKGGLEFIIHHRFSQIENYHNLFGIYGAANTRLGLDYGVTERLMIGLGTTRDYKLQDLHWKYLILRQTEDNSMPVTLAYYGNLVADLQSKEAFGPEETYKDIHRLSYFTQLIVARKISEKISVQVAPSVSYFNAVPLNEDTTAGYKNLNFGISVGGRANLFGAHSLILEYDQLLTPGSPTEAQKPNLAFGWEINTATHSFQVFAANYSQIINQRNMVFNANDFTKGEYRIGFNITVRF